jgi:hypothetical protein
MIRGPLYLRLVRYIGLYVDHAFRNAFPAAELKNGTAGIPQRARRAQADSRAAAGDNGYGPAQSSYPASTRSMISAASSARTSVWVAIRLVRNRHSLGAVAGGSELLTYTPCS